MERLVPLVSIDGDPGSPPHIIHEGTVLGKESVRGGAVPRRTPRWIRPAALLLSAVLAVVAASCSSNSSPSSSTTTTRVSTTTTSGSALSTTTTSSPVTTTTTASAAPAAAIAAINAYETTNGPPAGTWQITSTQVSSVDSSYIMFRIGPAPGHQDSVQGGYGFVHDQLGTWTVVGFGSAQVGCPPGGPQAPIVPTSVLTGFGLACPPSS